MLFNIFGSATNKSHGLKRLFNSVCANQMSLDCAYIDNESNPSREAMLIATKLKLATGSYILQQKRAKFIHNEKPTCKLCDTEDEDVEHFILRCVCLQPIRSSYLNNLSIIFHEATAKNFMELPSSN